MPPSGRTFFSNAGNSQHTYQRVDSLHIQQICAKALQRATVSCVVLRLGMSNYYFVHLLYMPDLCWNIIQLYGHLI